MRAGRSGHSRYSGRFDAFQSDVTAAEGTTAACRALHADTTLPEGARYVRANEISYKITSKVLPVVDRANQTFQTEIKRLQLKIAAPAQDTTIKGVQLQTEIRLFLRDQSPADKRKEITKAIAGGDDQVVAAILSAPPMLSGLSQPEVESFRLMWQQKRWPDELKRIAQLEKAAGAVNLGGILLISHQRKMSNPGIVREAAAFQKASADAIRAATGSIQ
jgi:hypothetical protein